MNIKIYFQIKIQDKFLYVHKQSIRNYLSMSAKHTVSSAGLRGKENHLLVVPWHFRDNGSKLLCFRNCGSILQKIKYVWLKNLRTAKFIHKWKNFFYHYHCTTTAMEIAHFASVIMVLPWYCLQMIWRI